MPGKHKVAGQETGKWVVEVVRNGRRFRKILDSLGQATMLEKRWRKGQFTPEELGTDKATPRASRAAVAEGQTMTLQALYDEAEPHTYHNRGVRYKQSHRAAFTRFHTWATRDLGRPPLCGDVNEGMLERYLTHLQGEAGLSAALYNSTLVLIRKAFLHGHKNGLPVGTIPQNPKRPKVEARTTFLRPDTEERVIAKLYEMGRPVEADFVGIACLMGFRCGELLNLQPDDLTPTGVILRTQKNGKRNQTLPCPQAVLTVLKERLPWACTHTTIRNHLRRAQEALGIPEGERITPHGTRHTFASRLGAKGATLKQIGNLLRHSDPRQTDKYTHFTDAEQSPWLEELASASPLLQLRKKEADDVPKQLVAA